MSKSSSPVGMATQAASNRLTIDIDDEVVLPIVLKELDHLQAIVGRYDTFFFLMKQISLGAIFAAVLAYFNKPFGEINLLIAVPIIFLFLEFSFRCAYWSSFIVRILEVEQFLQRPSPNFLVYNVNQKVAFRQRLRTSFQVYDLLFYGMTAVLLALTIYFRLPRT